jgi:hypothetical protein
LAPRKPPKPEASIIALHLKSTSRPSLLRRTLTVLPLVREVRVERVRLFVQVGAARAGVSEQDLVEAVPLDVQRRARVSEVAEGELAELVAPVHRAAGLLDEALGLDLLADPHHVGELPEVRDEALADLRPRHLRLLEHGDRVALLRDVAGGRATGGTAANHHHVVRLRHSKPS